MTVTKILGAQSGLQYQGVQDKSEADPRDSLANTLFTGQFKRGPFNKPFKVTKANIRAKLGYDPDNLQYQAIEDVLHQGVPFVWVMRISRFSCMPNKLIIPASTWKWDQTNGISIYCELWVDGKLEREGRVYSDLANCRFYFNAQGQFTADAMLLNTLFFYSGIDLYRQSAFQVQNFAIGASGTSPQIGDGFELMYGNYTPLNDRNFYLQGHPSIAGNAPILNSPYVAWRNQTIELRFKYDPDLQPGYTDVVRQLWPNKEPTLFSCAYIQDIGA